MKKNNFKRSSLLSNVLKRVTIHELNYLIISCIKFYLSLLTYLFVLFFKSEILSLEKVSLFLGLHN